MSEVGGYRTLAQLYAATPPAPVPPPLPPGPAPSARPSEQQQRSAPTTTTGYDATPAGEDMSTYTPLAPLLQREGTWTIPFTPITLPTPDRLMREGSEIVREWHPRDPGVHVTGTHADQPSPSPVPAPTEPEPAPTSSETPPRPTEPAETAEAPAEQPAGDPSAAASGGERSGAAKVAMMIGIGGGFAQNAIDVVRLAKKYPEALRAGQFDPSLGKLGRLPTALGLTALTRPDNRIVDPRWRGMAASIETGGRTFDRFDDVAMKTSVLLGASLAAIQIGSSIPNLYDALSKDGPWYENLAMSTSGRAGVLQLAGGTLGAAVFATALKQSAGQAGPGIVSKVMTAASAPIMARPIWGRIGLATGGVVLANELGYFDWANKGETRSTGTVLSDAAHKTPVLNDPEFRTAAIMGAGGIVGFKAHRAIAAAGGLSGLGKGHVIGGAIVTGLLGAQLLGGLSALDKPSG